MVREVNSYVFDVYISVSFDFVLVYISVSFNFVFIFISVSFDLDIRLRCIIFK